MYEEGNQYKSNTILVAVRINNSWKSLRSREEKVGINIVCIVANGNML